MSAIGTGVEHALLALPHLRRTSKAAACSALMQSDQGG